MVARNLDLATEELSLLRPPRGKRMIEYRDKSERGLSLRITTKLTGEEGGTAAWCWRFTASDGRQRRIVYGRLPSYDYIAAVEAHRAAKQMHANGLDPIEEQGKAYARRASAPTVTDMIDAYEREHASELKSGAEQVRLLRRYFEPVLGDKKIGEIEPGDITDLIVAEKARLSDAGKSGVQVTRLYSAIRVAFDLAVERREIPISPVPILRRKSRLLPRAKGKRRPLLDNEIKVFWLVVDALVEQRKWSQQIAIALKLILTTGMRPGEIIGLRRGDITVQADKNGEMRAVAYLRDTKAGREYLAALNRLALDLINEVQELNTNDQLLPDNEMQKQETNDRLFPDIAANTTLSQAVRRHRGAFGFADEWSPHCLRATVADRIDAMADRFVSARVLNHSDSSVTGANYSRYDFLAEKADAMETYGAAIEKLVGIERADNVVGIERRNASA